MNRTAFIAAAAGLFAVSLTSSTALAVASYTLTHLGDLGGNYTTAAGINASAQVVGMAYTTDNAAYHAFLYSGSTMTDLNALINPQSGWTLDDARGINDLGQITGNGTIAGQMHAFLLTPVPEPASLGLLTLGVMGMGARRRSDGR